MTTQPFSPVSITSEAVNVLERFTCILYDKSTPLTSVNELRQELFCKRGKSMENIPPTTSAQFLNEESHENRVEDET